MDDTMVEVKLSDAAMCVLSLDDSEVRREYGMEVARHLRRAWVFRLSVTNARRLADSFATSYGGEWDNGPGAGRSCRAAERALLAAITKSEGR